MRDRNRTGRRWALGATAGVAGLVVLTGCGAAATTSADPSSVDQQALSTLGISSAGTSDVSATASPDPSASPGGQQGRRKHPRLRRYLRRHTLHGTVTVQTKKGPQTVAVQRGTVVSVTSTELTVKSSDGFTETWRLTGDTRVRAHRERADASAVKANEQVGVAGKEQGKTDTARLVVVVAK
ncbi:hypothetical protein Athai_64980 [Actinocatenispora thailandica]|uniref:DUF5666 domain-containing protein n=1 Tax=Actinocatenispora thailandica TaxID=227318 RepID=A0A7R7DW57_9ACTN|nr:hypothetical protein [Actinocatenispora thailandica]BCJ38995.1 hypothetical protein Athai_64980 [Actinocatenispora thailandica]